MLLTCVGSIIIPVLFLFIHDYSQIILITPRIVSAIKIPKIFPT